MRVITLLLLCAAKSLAATLSIDQRLASLESKIDALTSDDEDDGEVAALRGITLLGEGPGRPFRTMPGACAECKKHAPYLGDCKCHAGAQYHEGQPLEFLWRCRPASDESKW